MEQRDFSVLTMIYDRVNETHTEVMKFKEDLAATKEEVAVLKDRSNRAMRWSGFGVIGSLIAGAVGYFRS